MTEPTNTALDAPVAKMGTQIGDDVAVIYDHECLFIQARAAITALRAGNAAIRAQIAEAEARGRIAGLKEAAAIAIAHDYTIQSSTAADCRAAQIAAAILALIGDAT